MASATSSLLYPSSPPSHELRSSSPSSPPLDPPPVTSNAFAMSCLTMTLGVVSNLMALGVLAKSLARFRRRSRATFLLLAVALLLNDLAGHLIPGAFALWLHLGPGRGVPASEGQSWNGARDPPEAFCQLFGACMVFFGLCPLLLGGAMAAERCMGITRPLLHSTTVTASHVGLTVALLSSLALLLAVLPLLAVGRYVPQFPGTWCFLSVQAPLSVSDAGLVLAFSGLGLLALGLSLLCNTISSVALLRARLASQGSRPPHLGAGCHSSTSSSSSSSSSSSCSLDVEMIVQLLGITVVSYVCWCPFLIFISMSAGQFHSGTGQSAREYERLVLLGLRMASWNQILDPWVYILLRRAVLRRVYRLLRLQSSTLTHSRSCADSRRQDICLRRPGQMDQAKRTLKQPDDRCDYQHRADRTLKQPDDRCDYQHRADRTLKQPDDRSDYQHRADRTLKQPDDRSDYQHRADRTLKLQVKRKHVPARRCHRSK